ncbi:Uu.00g083620.m01.CDS01 [Anthostomella pinea]|uniref:Uu.00g083620.m01.CDS01 n=1 Tax=Anthostomella pinea TaxID=933095 RepID=A0AAI8VLK1_9PEZI|nr:Uu.00g083620.m01.CDS01 [Anthostomella pinea]
MKWYQEVHRPRMVRLVHKHNVFRYSLFLTPSFMRQQFHNDLQETRPKPGWQMADFDVTTSYWVRSPDDLRNMLADPEWDSEVQDKEDGWIDMDRASIQVGFETVFVDDGQIVEAKV